MQMKQQNICSVHMSSIGKENRNKERERENSNNLFHKDCSLDPNSFKYRTQKQHSSTKITDKCFNGLSLSASF